MFFFFFPQEALKRLHLIEKNLTLDNRHLRGRVNTLETENTTLKASVDNLESLIKVFDLRNEKCYFFFDGISKNKKKSSG